MTAQHNATSGTDEFARIADAAPVPMWVTALDRRRLFVNRAYADFLGCDVADAVDFDWRTILHAGDAARIVAESVAGEASLKPFALEARYRRGDGEWRWLRSVSQPRFDAAGAHIGFIGVAHDVTAAKAAELELREREAQLSAFIEQTDAGFGQVDLTGRFTLVNDRFCRIVGRTRAELLKLTLRDITHPDDLPRNLDMFGAAVREGTSFSLEKRYVRPDGSCVWVNNSVSVIRRPDGEPYGVLAVTVDVTARREAEAAVRANEARLAFLDALGSRTASATDADAVLAITARMLGEHLDLSDCAYADMEADEDTFHIRGDWHAPDAPSIVGTYSLTTFGSLAVANLRGGRPLVVNDNIAELGDDGAKAFVDIGIRATICMPLVKQERLTALMAVHAAEPRTWTDGELALLREVTERSWAHIERVRAQAALRESDERLRLAIDGARIGTWEWDLCTGAGTWSPRTCEIMGVDPDVAVTPELRLALIHPDDRMWMPGAVARLRERGGTNEFSNEYRIVRSDGGVRWVASRGVVIRDAQGDAIRVTGTMRDVTERRTAQDSLAALNRTLEQRIADRTAERDRMWRLSGDLFVVVGTRREVRAVNPAIGALGYAPADVVGRTLDAFIHPDDQRDVDAMIHRAARSSIGEFSARVLAASGEWRCYSWSAAPGEGEAYVIGRDITADVQHRHELEQAREALRQSQKVESLGQLTGGVAHDFNNLLTPIIGNLDLLQRVPLGDGSRIRRLAGAALESAERARTLVQRLLAFARRQPLQPCPVDLAALVHGMAGLIASTSGPRVEVAIDAPEGLPLALADVNQIEMAILNLSVNARDAMPDGGTLTLKVEPADGAGCGDLGPGEYLRLSVSDTGVGMDEETRTRAIEPFFSTKGLGKGTGLGLSMVHGLASQLGGRMTLESRPGLGTTVALLLPVAEKAREIPGDTAGGSRPAQGAGAVLLVDDDVPVRRTTAEMLRDLGFRVTEAGSAEEALSALGDARPDYLVTDHIMPGMTGADLAQAARRMHAGLPILIVSGYAELESIPADLSRLAKPFRVDELAACMKALA